MNYFEYEKCRRKKLYKEMTRFFFSATFIVAFLYLV